MIISVLVPVYNEEKNISLFYNRISTVLKKISDKYDYEIIFSDNCSSDDTVYEIKKIYAVDKKIRIISLSRNFGRNASQLALLNIAKGNLLFMIDVDCEDQPELLLDFVKYYEQGYDIVYGIRNRINESLLKFLFAKLFYRVTKLLSENNIIKDMGEFVLFTDSIKKEIIKTNTSFPFIRAELSYVGFKRKGIDYKRDVRKYGKTNYSFIKLLFYAASGFLSSTTFLLRFNSILGFLLILINSLYLISNKMQIDFIIKNIIFLIVLNVNLIFFMLISISIYVARTYNNSLKRPVYIIDYNRSVNINEK
jgi:glycosyltransferase involved in cell wall biosynthesis